MKLIFALFRFLAAPAKTAPGDTNDLRHELPLPYYTRVVWKIHRLTKKGLCHINERRRAFNSTLTHAVCLPSG